MKECCDCRCRGTDGVKVCCYCWCTGTDRVTVFCECRCKELVERRCIVTAGVQEMIE